MSEGPVILLLLPHGNVSGIQGLPTFCILMFEAGSSKRDVLLGLSLSQNYSHRSVAGVALRNVIDQIDFLDSLISTGHVNLSGV